MKKLRLHIGLLIFSVAMMAGSICYASEPYLDNNRVAYISSILQAFSKTKLQDIFNAYRYISVVDNNNCRSNLSDLRVECLLSFANQNCKEMSSAELKGRCELYSDIIIVNKLSEKAFIDRTERYRILKNAGYDHRTAIANRLQQKYARIVTQFSLTEAAKCDDNDFECLAKGLDQFCLDYTNSQSLSWQYCVSATLWFIGTSKNN
jgi:hypothetical protein